MPARRWASRRSPIRCGRSALRYDPADPLWPNRDRFVLSNGHACMMLYALIHLAGVKRARRPPYHRCAGDQPRRHQELPPDRQRHAGPSGIWPHHRRRVPRPVRSARAAATASAWRSPRAGSARAITGDALHDFRLRRLRDLQRRRFDGRRGERSRFARRASAARQSVLDLRQQHRDHRRPHPDLAFSEDVETRFKAYRWNVLRVRDANDTEAIAAALELFQPHRRSSNAHHRRQHHWLRRAAQAEHRGRPQRPARRGGSSPRQALLRLAGRRAIPGARRRLRAFPATASADAGARCATNGARPSPATAKNLPQAARRDRNHAGRRIAGTVGCAACRLFRPTTRASPRAKPPARCSMRIAKTSALADRRRGRPVAIDQDRTSTATSRSKPTTPAARSCISASANMPWAPSSTDLGLSKLRAFGATFLTFSDYMRPPIRLAALMDLPVFHVFTHDSIGLGEDGPTHQPIEQLVALRAIPNIDRAAPGRCQRGRARPTRLFFG